MSPTTSKHNPRYDIADDEDADGAHEECDCRQRKDPICYIPDRFLSAAEYLCVALLFVPKVPPLHVVVALFSSERVAFEVTAPVQSDGWREPGR